MLLKNFFIKCKALGVTAKNHLNYSVVVCSYWWGYLLG